MRGKIIKGIAGFYYVHTPAGLYECKAKGIFRKDGMKPLVGDDVEVEVLDQVLLTGNIIRILPRSNALIRPACANVDQSLVIFAIVKPEPNYNLLDRFLISMERQKLPAVICFNKKDLASEKEQKELCDAYSGCGYQVLFVSGIDGRGMEKIQSCLKGKTTVVAGPSGVGKSTIVNALYPKANMETGEISRKIERGRHTTRHAQLFALSDDTFIMDTPGFSSLYVNDFEKEELRQYFPEFAEYEGTCRFNGCSHVHEPGCMVRNAVENGRIHPVRYQDYTEMYEELKNKRRY